MKIICLVFLLLNPLSKVSADLEVKKNLRTEEIIPESATKVVELKFPPKQPLLGRKKLACVAISYTDNKNRDLDIATCKRVANKVSDFYVRNSRKKVTFGVAAYKMDYPGPASDFAKAEQLAKKTYAADYYIIPSFFRKFNHANGGIAHVIQLTYWVNQHEVGHLLGLQHTGRYDYLPNGKISLVSYGDHDSVMGNKGSSYLTAAQYYFKDWLNKDEVALWDGTPQVFEVSKLSNLAAPGLSAVAVPNSLLQNKLDSRAAFLSFPPSCVKACVAIHLAKQGGSQRVKMTENEYYDDKFTGIHVKILESTKDKVKFSVDFNKNVANIANRSMAIEPEIEIDDSGKTDFERDEL